MTFSGGKQVSCLLWWLCCISIASVIIWVQASSAYLSLLFDHLFLFRFAIPLVAKVAWTLCPDEVKNMPYDQRWMVVQREAQKHGSMGRTAWFAHFNALLPYHSRQQLQFLFGLVHFSCHSMVTDALLLAVAQDWWKSLLLDLAVWLLQLAKDMGGHI